MKYFWKRMLACLLTVIMLAGLVPTAAYAAVSELVTRSAMENAALLEALRQVYGDDAEAHLAVLERYGLIDENGGFVTDEKIVMNGVEYTLDEIESILDNPDTDLSTVVEVDGTYLTLEELKTIVEIERYLAYVKATYFTEQELTGEQIDSFYDLTDAWANGDVMMLAANDLTGLGPAGVDHGVTLSVSAPDTAAVGGTYTVTVTASPSLAAPNQKITFDWRAVGDSVCFADETGGTVELHPGEEKAVTIQVTGVNGRLNGTTSFLVQIYNVQNALISGGPRWEHEVKVSSSDNMKYHGEASTPIPCTTPGIFALTFKKSDGGTQNNSYYGLLGSDFFKRRDFINTGEGRLSVSGLADGNYFQRTEINGKFIQYIGDRYQENWGQIISKYCSDRNSFQSYRLTIDGESQGNVLLDRLNGSTTEQAVNKAVEKYFNLDNTDTVESTFKVEINNAYHLQPDDGEPATSEERVFCHHPYNLTAALTVQETTTDTEVSFSIPAGTYYAGQNVPITAKFAFPVKITSNMTITVNGETSLAPVEVGTTGETCTFFYPVDENSGGSLAITGTNFLSAANANRVTGANERGMTVNLSGSSPVTVGTEAPGVSLESIDREKAFNNPQLTVTKDENNKPQLNVIVPLSENEKYTTWVLSELAKNGNVLNSLQVMTDQTGDEKFPFRPNSEDKVTALTAVVPLPYNTSTNTIELAADFFLDNSVWMGRGLTAQVEGSVLVEAGDISPVLTVTPSDGPPQTYAPGQEVPLLYAQQNNSLTLSFTLAGASYTWGNTSKVGYYNGDGVLVGTAPHFAWRSDNPAVAAVSVQDDGTVTLTPTGMAGTTVLTLTALNGPLDDAVSDSISVTFAVGADPFLMIPDSSKTVSIREGQNAVINWSSNICSKNETSGEDGSFVPTTFLVSLYSSIENKTTPVWTTTLTTTAENRNISSVTIPWDPVLKEIYEADVRAAAVTVSTVYNGVSYGSYQDEMQQWHESATAIIQMTSQPASVVLDVPEGGLYQTDGGTGKDITLTWTVPHLDTLTGGQFELYIAGGNFTVPIVENTVGSRVTQTSDDTYSYTLKVPAVVPTKDPSSYRNSYTITVKAKNAAESTWAYSSYVLYVYSENALRLLLDGAAADSSHIMSNVDEIARLWATGGSDAIVALQRDIALKNVISINYGEYAWAELADQIAWNSSKSDVATVNYQQGTLYENIENFSYTSYRPSTDFILSGLKDGTTTITAQHVKTGITDSVTVQVETLRDQLYLFQCYPKAVTTLTYDVYTNASRTATEQMTLNTNANGEAAIYAPHGIAGDVYCKSDTEEGNEIVTYVGTIYNRSLVSSEADSTKLQLYPVNTLRLRRAAQAEIYLKKPDGTPYQGPVTFRGGVYRQGEYCLMDTVKFGLQDNDRKDWETGDQKQLTNTGPDGRLLVTMDLMQFKTSAEQKDVQAGEKLYYLFQLEYGSGESAECYPIMLRVDATLNLDDIAASGDSIVAWEKNEYTGKRPYVAQQTLKYSSSANANVANVRKSTGNVGPSTTFPKAYLTTTVMWWGDENANDPERVNSVLLQDTTGKTPACQTSKIITYPFTDLVFTENVMTMDESAMRKWGIGQGENRSMRAVLSEDGKTVSRTISLPFKIFNMIGVEKAEDSENLPEAIANVKSSLTVDAGDKMDLGDKMIQSGMKLLASDAQYNPEANRDTFMVRLFATSDPTVFRALFCLSGGNMSSGGNVTGVYPEYGNTEDMTFVNVDSPDGGMDNSDRGLMPNPMNIYDMAKGRYLDKMADEGRQAADGKKTRSFNMDLGGYFEADIAYNSESGSWECRPVTGGFHVGGGLNYTWNFNSMVGPVPVTASITLGGTLEVRLDVQASRYVHVFKGEDAVDAAVRANDEAAFKAALAEASISDRTDTDYLTSLRLFMYIRAFAGVGFDFSVVAFKIGVFGQLDLDLQFRWLNRNYLQPNRYDRYSMAGPVSSRDDEVMFGSNASVSGSTGIEFFFKFLFISYEKIFCSVGFKAGQSIEDWDTIDKIWAANKKINNQPVTRMFLPNGQAMYAVDLGAQLERRDYVYAAEQEWLGGQPSIGLFSLDQDQSAPRADVLQTGAYSYANPVLSDDGEIMFYLSDRGTGAYADATDLTNTRVAVSTKRGGQFQPGIRFDNDNEVPAGYGDSNVKAAGSRGGYAAVWVRQVEDFSVSSGDGGTLDAGQQMLQMKSTEIIAATSDDGSNWTLTQLTDNGTPDLAPVVAANGSRTVVAWREASSSSAAELTNFDQQDAIRFAVCEGKTWSKTQTLYDGTGTSASVKGIEIAMLKDGTAAVVYTLDTNSSDRSNTDWETVLAIIPASEAETHTGGDAGARSEDTVRTFRLTSDSSLDENPQITAVNVDDTERFVAAWHTERAIAGTSETESDIRLAVMDKNGVLYEKMPESLGWAADGTGDTVGSNFRFAKNADHIGNLSILWADTVSGEANETHHDNLARAVADGYENMGHDVLKAVKFVEDDSSYTLSGTVDVSAMADNTLIDHFDAYMDNGDVKSVILGTDYSQTAERTVTVSDGETDQVMTIKVANPVSGMYTAAAEFTNQITEPAVMLEYEQLYPNSGIDVQFTIRNTGKDAVTALSITSKDGMDTYYSTMNDPLYNGSTGTLRMLPNRDITVTAKIPTRETIQNTDYVIKASFGSETVELPGTLYLDIPDVGVSKVETIKEANGERTLRCSLYNALSAKLADRSDGWQVQVGFYADQSCTELLQDDTGHDLIRTITSEDDLALIDGGGYSVEITLPAASYARAENGAQEEIPGTGIPVYVKAWVEAPAGTSLSRTGTYDTVREYFQGNNTTSLTLDNLAVRRGEDVTLQSAIDNSGEVTSVTVDVQYNKLADTTSGNLIVTLLDAGGLPLEKLQSYTDTTGLLTLSEEGTAEKIFTFSQKGADVKVEFSDLILGESSVELDHVSLTGTNVTYDPATKTYTATGAGLTSGILDIAPKDPNAAITLSNGSYNAKGTHITGLVPGTTTWTITVTNGGNAETYTLVLNNAGSASGGGVPVTGVSLNKSSVELMQGETEQLAATISPANATIRDLIWTSSDTKIATVDSNGNITAVSAGTTVITVTTADGGYTAACVVTVSSTQMKVEIKEGISDVPEAFKNMEHLNTPEKITAAMRTAITQLGIPSGNTAVYDVTLMINDGSGWKKADANNFPADGLTVTLPYPKGTSSCGFKVVHMFTTSDFGKTPGATEMPAVTNTADGIRFTVTGLSPISVGWTAAEPEKPAVPDDPGTGGGSGGSGSSSSSGSYAVTVTKPEHGKVTASPSSASSGSTVTLTVTPDSGYVLDTLTVTDSQGNEIKLTAQGDGRYTFTMPNRAVTVKATFAPLPGDTEKPCDGGTDCPSRAFTDLGGVGTWYHEAVDYALRNKLMGGYGDGLFGPDNNLTRAQLAQILYNREGRPAVTGSSPFTDVANGEWYFDAITWSTANGIVNGYGNGCFGPDDNITREQLAAILWRCSKSPAAANQELRFNDVDEISGYALDAIRWAVEHDILNGFGDGRLGPKGLATRAQVAQMLKNFIENQEENT